MCKKINLIILLILLLFNSVISQSILNDDTFLILDTDEDDLVRDTIRQVKSEPTSDQIEFITVQPKRNLLTSLEGADKLSEWTPISNQIGANEIQYYEFVVNTTQTGLGAYYEILIFLSGNICSFPEDLEDKSSQLEVYYTFNQSDMFNLSAIDTYSIFEFGYMQALASNPTADPFSNLYIAVKTPSVDQNITGLWSYEMGISQNDLVFQWDDRSWATLVDSDDHSALLVTGNLSSQNPSAANGSLENEDIYKLHIYSTDYKQYFDGLDRSWCAFNRGPTLIPKQIINTKLTTRFGNLKQQFYVTGLNSSTYYVGYLTQDYGGSEYGGTIFSQFSFETLEEGSCELIFDLTFCEGVAYSVPASKSYLNETDEESYGNKPLLAAIYDNHTEELYQNFAKAIEVVACDDELDSRYSPIRTCSDCITSYKSWLCSVTIPRCSTRNITGYKYREVGANRNKFIDDVIQPPQPYFEILPCIETCQSIVIDCPSDFGFACPSGNKSIAVDYYWDAFNEHGYPSCNDVDASTAADTKTAVLLVRSGLVGFLKPDYKLLIGLIISNWVILT